VLDVRGRMLATLVDEALPVGMHVVEWRAADHPAGVYFVRLEADGMLATRKMVLAR
jgi:hypothetical protein